jgi:hypothetical protein
MRTSSVRGCRASCRGCDPAEGIDRGVVGLVEGAEVLLGGNDAGVAEPLLYDLEVGSPGQQP